MEIFLEHKIGFAFLIVRLIVGVLFFIQGYEKVFRIHLKPAGDAAASALRSLPFPGGIIKSVLFVTAAAELICGGLLIVGFWILPSCYILSACLLPVTIAMSMKDPLWNLQHVAVRLALLVFLLLAPVTIHVFSLDSLLSMYGNLN